MSTKRTKPKPKSAKKSADNPRTRKPSRSSAAGNFSDQPDPAFGEPVAAFHATEAIRKGNPAVLARYLLEAREVILAVADRAEKLKDHPGSAAPSFQTHRDDDDPLGDYEDPDASSALVSITNGDGSTLADFLRGLEDVHVRLAEALWLRSKQPFRLEFVPNLKRGRRPLKARDRQLGRMVLAKRETMDYMNAIHQTVQETGYKAATVERVYSKYLKLLGISPGRRK